MTYSPRTKGVFTSMATTPTRSRLKFQCRWCPNRFSTNQGKTAHERIGHKEQWEATYHPAAPAPALEPAAAARPPAMEMPAAGVPAGTDEALIHVDQALANLRTRLANTTSEIERITSLERQKHELEEQIKALEKARTAFERTSTGS